MVSISFLSCVSVRFPLRWASACVVAALGYFPRCLWFCCVCVRVCCVNKNGKRKGKKKVLCIHIEICDVCVCERAGTCVSLLSLCPLYCSIFSVKASDLCASSPLSKVTQMGVYSRSTWPWPSWWLWRHRVSPPPGCGSPCWPSPPWCLVYRGWHPADLSW